MLQYHVTDTAKSHYTFPAWSFKCGKFSVLGGVTPPPGGCFEAVSSQAYTIPPKLLPELMKQHLFSQLFEYHYFEQQ